MTYAKFTESRFFYRCAEGIMPVLTWLIITLPIWLSPFHPALVSYFILAFFMYFLYKTIKNVYHANISYRLVNKAEKIDWEKKLKHLLHYNKIHHYIIITNYKESIEKLQTTIEKIRDQKYPNKQVNIVLAMEKREGDEAVERSNKINELFKKDFEGIYTTYHVLVEGEVVGKASNETFASRYIEKVTNEQGILPEDILITVCDADSLLPDQYLSYLTVEYLKDSDRLYHFYWAPVLLYNNFWKLTIPVRVQSILSSVLRLALLSQKDELIQISTYSSSLWLLKSVDYWDVDIIPEDWHIHLQAFFKHGNKVKTLPIYLPISADPVYTNSRMNTFKNRYEQERRWAGGVSDIPYAILESFRSPHIPWSVKLKKISILFKNHLLWPTSFFILTVSGWIPSLVNPDFKRTVMGLILPQVSSFIMTIGSIFILGIIYFDYKMREKVNIKTKITNIPLLFIQWYFLPIISFVFSALPALDAHTRLLLGKTLEYKVTEKA